MRDKLSIQRACRLFLAANLLLTTATALILAVEPGHAIGKTDKNVTGTLGRERVKETRRPGAELIA